MNQSEEEHFIPGSLISAGGWNKPNLYVILAKWRINSHEHMYRILSQNGKVFEARYDPEHWSKIV